MKTTVVILSIILTLANSVFANGDKTKDANKQADAMVLASSLVGVVMDKLTGEPLTGVEVGIVGTNLKAYTDFDGRFTIANLTPGKYSISTSLISYKNNGNKQVEVNEGKEFSLNLELETIRN
jgi:hypothetical protein